MGENKWGRENEMKRVLNDDDYASILLASPSPRQLIHRIFDCARRRISVAWI